MEAMEDVILKLLVTDTNVIQQATAQIQEAFKKSECIRHLYQLVVSSTNPQVRQYAALLLRKRYTKGKYWTALPEEIKTDLKTILLQALVQEPEKLVKNNIAQLIGVVVKHELPKNKCLEVFQFIRHQLASGNLSNQELGMYTLSVMTEITQDVYLPHAQTIMEMLNETLNSFCNLANPVSCYILDTLLHLVPLIEGNQLMVNAYHQMLPRIMQIIQSLVTVNPEKAVKGFELLHELCEIAPIVVSPYIENLLEMCIVIANDRSLDEDLRKKAITFIGLIAKTKKKALVKLKLVEAIIDMLFSQMCAQPDDENQEIYFGNDDDNTLVTSATHTLDQLALHLPPEKLFPHLVKHIEPGLERGDAYTKKASYLSLAVLAEGCSEYIKSKYLEPFLRCICCGIGADEPVVRNAALFALGQFSEHLQPDISRYAHELLPPLLRRFDEICVEIRHQQKDPDSSDRVFYAVEMFAENLNEGLLPFLPDLMAILFSILEDSASPVHLREQALSAIGAAANASKEHIEPYFQRIIGILECYLTSKPSVSSNDEITCLKVQAVDTLGVLARTVGQDNFSPLASRSVALGMDMLKDTDDPDLKKSVYGLLASLSVTLKGKLSPVLPEIVTYLITSVQSSEGIVTQLKTEDTSQYLIYEDSSESDGAEEEDIENTDDENNDKDDDDDYEDDIAGYSIENAYIEEKEEAILALRELAEHTEQDFLPYLEEAFKEVFKLANYPQEDIRKAAVVALSQFCINFSKIETPDGKQATQQALCVFVPKLAELIRLDGERSVVLQGLDAYAELLEHIKSDVLVGSGHKDAIENCVTEVMLGRTSCQDGEEAETESDGDEGEAEHDELLFECAGQVLVNLGNSMTSQDYAVYFGKVLPILIKRSVKNSNSDAQRSFSIGTIIECFPALNDCVAIFALQLLPIFIKLTNDSCDEVRSNTIFGLGELAYYGKEVLYPHYFEILQTLSRVTTKEKNAGARDNIIGAIARLIITNHSIVPLEQVFPVFVSQLPLKEDLEENKTVYKCIMQLYGCGHVILKPHLSHLLQVSFRLLETENTDTETKSIVVEFMKSVQRDFPADIWNPFCNQLGQEISDRLHNILK
ncbi:importin-4 [Copidosoma floridanum]|uniref:importin-4 n=1 Tax=Copidosoma floridanum TaxID=29053 RepID=UPI0006C94327|nr:importin-4 [Copidosoma floridanum]XP_014209389.1 importin-4 [Copidosoma floridanum]